MDKLSFSPGESADLELALTADVCRVSDEKIGFQITRGIFVMDSMEMPLFPDGYKAWDYAKEGRPSILLHPNIPIPLHGIVPRIILGKKWWDLERAEAKERTQNHCAACGVYGGSCKGSLKRLEGHEQYEINWRKCISEYVATDPLCPYCHSYIHSGRLRMLLDEGKISHQHYAAIRKHGDAIIARAGLKPRGYCAGKNYPEWGKWRLKINGVYYKGHSSEQAYREFHKGE